MIAQCPCGTTVSLPRKRGKTFKCTECTYTQTDSEIEANFEAIRVRDMKCREWPSRKNRRRA